MDGGQDNPFQAQRKEWNCNDEVKKNIFKNWLSAFQTNGTRLQALQCHPPMPAGLGTLSLLHKKFNVVTQ